MTTNDSKNSPDFKTESKKKRITEELQQEFHDLTDEELKTIDKLATFNPSPPDSNFQEQLKAQLVTEHRKVKAANKSEGIEKNMVKNRETPDASQKLLWGISRFKFTGAAAAVLLAAVLAFTMFSPVTEDTADESELDSNGNDIIQQESEPDYAGPKLAQDGTREEKSPALEQRSEQPEKDSKRAEYTDPSDDGEKYFYESRAEVAEPDAKEDDKEAPSELEQAEVEDRETKDADDDEPQEQTDDMHLTTQDDQEESEEEFHAFYQEAKEQEQVIKLLEDILTQFPDPAPIYETAKINIGTEKLQEEFNEITADQTLPLNEQQIKSSVNELVHRFESEQINILSSLVKINSNENSGEDKEDNKVFQFSIEHQMTDNFTIVTAQRNFLEISAEGEIDGHITALYDKEQIDTAPIENTEQLKEKILTKELNITKMETGYKITDNNTLIPILYDKSKTSRSQATVSVVAQ